MHTNGPDQRDCAECGKPIGNRPRVTRADGKVVCVPCHQKRYPHFIHFNDLDIPLEPICGEARDGSWRVLDWIYAGMPRIKKDMETCVAFLHDADGNRGGTGFLMARPWATNKALHHFYLVSCAHVVSSYPIGIYAGPTPVQLTTGQSLWEGYPGGAFDLSIADITESVEPLPLTVNLGVVGEDLLALRRDIEKLDIGIGDEICMLGLFDDDIPHPVGRFGSIAALAHEDIPIKSEFGPAQPSHLADMRSRDGYSGSPVFVYRTPATTLASFSAKPPKVGELVGHWTNATEDNLFLRLLGVHRGQFQELTKVRDAVNAGDAPLPALVDATLKIDSAMTTIVPAWAIATLLTQDRFEDMRKKREANYKPPKGKTVKAEVKNPKREENPNHRADFNRLLGAAVKPPKSSD